MKNILKILFTIIVIMVILVNIFSMLHLSLFGFRLYRVGSGSMEPYLNINDYILVRESKDYKIDDVVTYKVNENVYVTHRIIDIKEDEIITKGDANNVEDDPIKEDSIVGKLVMKLVVLGFILYLFSNPISWVLLLAIGLVITLLIPNKKTE